MAFMEAVRETALPLPLLRRGKVRDLYELDAQRLLMVATDRISAFDVVLPQPIPGKGVILTQLSLFWFRYFADFVPNHVLEEDPTELPPLRPYAGLLRGRALVVRRAQPIPVECVARGYLAGSAWREYQQCGSVASIPLPPGLCLGSPLPTVLFTPARKVLQGHDENITFAQLETELGSALAHRLRELTVELYRRAAEYCRQRGLILVDTKLEFGYASDGQLLLIDELLTPDSSRFWLAEEYESKGVAVDMDKQFVRDYLERIGWNRQPPAPQLPPEVIEQTRQRYCEALRRLVPQARVPCDG